MGLDAVGEVVEADGVRDFAGVYAARQVLHAIRHFVPDAVELFWGSFLRWFDPMTLFYQGIQVDHLEVVVECVQDMLAGDARWERGDCRED